MFRIISFNLLCAGRDERRWENRVPLVCRVINEYQPDSFGVQEAHIGWMNALRANLPDYDDVGVGREDGKEDGEFSAVFFRKDRLRALKNETFWISETPDRPSRSWETACTRIATWALLEEIATGKQYVHINTHLDHVSRLAQVNGAKMLQQKAAEFSGLPVVCTGDFNVPQGSDCYETMVSANMGDARMLAPETDDCFTFHGFEPDRIQEIIDFIFVDRAAVRPLKFRTINKTFDGAFYSDHYAVCADLEF
ncbi:MAG: endonuclease/exonuclease/phosphatase family protein [Clostridia bacterium]|nr:endonuclease/exonuclease/phosphatase family protein [Clostridia bacterium]